MTAPLTPDRDGGFPDPARMVALAKEVLPKLTKAQRDALLEEVVRDGEAIRLRWNWPVRPATRVWLQRNGLWEAGMYNQEFTPLGLLVRQLLLEEAERASGASL